MFDYNIIFQAKKAINATGSMLDSAFDTFRKITGQKINSSGLDALKGCLMNFLCRIAIADNEIEDEELQFMSAIFDMIYNRAGVDTMLSNGLDYKPIFDIIVTIGNLGITKMLPAGTEHPMIILANLFTSIGQYYIQVFPNQKHVQKFHSEIDRLYSIANTDTSLPHHISPHYVSTAQNNNSASSSVPVHTPAASQHATMENPMEELNSLIGLSSIKKDVAELIGLVRMMKMREEKGMRSVPVSLHLVFTGNPGTGKTSVARILASLYKEIGVLKTGQLVEVDRSELVAGYIGQTAIKTQQKINEALGGILFIDEAYTLVKEGNDFGQEAIDTILKEMEDKRGQFIVIVAGYTEPMKKFIESNPGLKSRFNKFFCFPDYTEQELIEIFDSMCKKYDYIVTESAHIAIENIISDMVYNKNENFANARDVRNLFERIITKQANKIAAQISTSEQDLITITTDDIL